MKAKHLVTAWLMGFSAGIATILAYQLGTRMHERDSLTSKLFF